MLCLPIDRGTWSPHGGDGRSAASFELKQTLLSTQLRLDYRRRMTNSSISIAPLVERVKLVVTDRTGCWNVVSADTRDAKALFKDFAAPMAVVGALVILVASFLFGVASMMGVRFVLFQFVASVLNGCASGLLMALIATQVASLVGGTVSFDRAYSWVVHSLMVGFVASLLAVVPIIGALIALVGSVATVYWAWTGIGTMMDVPAEKRAIFFVGTILLSILALAVVSSVLGVVLIGTVAGVASGPVTP